MKFQAQKKNKHKKLVTLTTTLQGIPKGVSRSQGYWKTKFET